MTLNFVCYTPPPPPVEGTVTVELPLKDLEAIHTICSATTFDVVERMTGLSRRYWIGLCDDMQQALLKAEGEARV